MYQEHRPPEGHLNEPVVRRAKLQGGALARRTRLVRPAAGGRGKLSHPAQSSGLLRPNHRVSLWPIGSDQLYKRKEASGTQASKKIETSLGFPFESTTSSEERQGEFRRSSHALLLVGSGQGYDACRVVTQATPTRWTRSGGEATGLVGWVRGGAAVQRRGRGGW